ncbi:thiamine pyrophosphate-dependent dehydrogenase E1 component subunit alpha [Conexibacter sp. CPCC 206217]|uniref:thiamine pyrophosphate-dependent dehydrogenase E1 component subunit alpha n=1 Tax=Conexibacter sp. CPCC 206217 TaxID=3064574 RepID=UPI0027202EBF|nr:thiamine pyrophosphate-dependent dehydrogenase E1 component subunit alpha [Conexibacter sp. CPCC 206217]MDO8211086.1 thiamine pyrophosphate-dependent dehydrogenase E1 component subunit alpha [Conexibacter sp. CPCC 206217]
MTPTTEQAAQLYETMVLIRRFEERAYEVFMAGRVAGAIHATVGQEAVPAGVCAHLRREDHVTSTHRGHGHTLAKGADPGRMFAELFGRSDGYCRGKGGSMHVADLAAGIIGANGIVGAGLPIAVGAGYSAQVRATDQVAVAFFGDGAVQEGAFHESLNLAATWRLPVLFVCENNGYAASMALARATPTVDVAKRAAGYGMPGITVDGMDVVAVHEAVGPAVQRARAGEGPTLIEAKTYRFLGHSRGDPGVGLYRDAEEVERWKLRDPLTIFTASGLLDDEQRTAIRDAVERRIDAAVAFAEASPFPAGAEALEDVYA